ncbi:response regulator transcription factor [Sphingosinicella sp. BN140058]|uniref:response regulator transcription factor n=1 Tax=Sphingosinicella sp. BN140058 TaxID=1892855 RepID=UPI0010110ED1|nr:response regulator [Sphingosinicella sp. BN140058]QAY79061.1 response regulator [Sphingosinicella sp. BN140058]
MEDRKMIAVVDDDESVRESLPELLKSFGFDARPFASAEAFLTSGECGAADCLILDVAMPGMSGPELQQALRRLGHRIPIIFITAHSDEKGWSALLASGAVACLIKPFSEDAILDAVRLALERE